MTLVILVYLGGVLSVLSPCILPVIPFVFARGDQPFSRTGLPLLGGMVLSFAVVATLAAVAGGWAVAASDFGRMAAIVVLGVFAVALLSERVAGALGRPVARLGDRLSVSRHSGIKAGVLPSALVGVATGLLWAPCAGPILGLVLTTAALQGAGVGTSLLLLAYAAGAATALAVILSAGLGVLGFLKRHLGLGVWVRRGLGVAVLAAVVTVATGADQTILGQVSFANTAPIEQWLVDHAGLRSHHPHPSALLVPERGDATPGRSLLIPASFAAGAQDDAVIETVGARSGLPVEGTLPSLSGAVEWLNSPPLSTEALRGKVVLVEFWTYACINCRHVLPYAKAWADKYRDAGLVVIGVHTPELAFEKVTANVEKAVRSYGITYPVAIDLSYKIWGAFDNQYWPANYLADAQGRIRYHHFGEGDYRGQERAIQDLLRDAGATDVPDGYVPAT